MTINFWLRVFFCAAAFATLSSCAANRAPTTTKPQPIELPAAEQRENSSAEETPPSEENAETRLPSSPAQPTIIRTESVEPKTPKTNLPNEPTEPTVSNEVDRPSNTSKTVAPPKLPPILDIQSTQKTGNLQNNALTEISGFSTSKDWPGVIYAINDSGNAAKLYAISESGQHLGEWVVEGRNRDWEDLASIKLDGQNYIVIGDTGDNLTIHKTSTLYFVREPVPGRSASGSIKPHMVVKYVYEDGPRNVEAFAVHDKTLFLISKEAVAASGPQASRLYSLEIPQSQPVNNLTARFLAELPVPRQSLEAKLAASFAGVDLNHPTALDIDPNGRRAYLLSYRQVRRYERLPQQSWAEVFQTSGTRIHFHQLGQAEALALAVGRAVFITSENRAAPVWAIPIKRYQ